MAINAQLNSILDELRTSVPDLRGAVIATADGLAVAHSLSGGDSSRIAAMLATAIGLGKRICDTVGGGVLAETSFTGVGGQVCVYSAGQRGVLGVLASPGSNIGLIHLEARTAAAKVQQILS